MSTKSFIITAFVLFIIRLTLRTFCYDATFGLRNLNTFEYKLIYCYPLITTLFFIYFIPKLYKAIKYYFNNGEENNDEDK
ncbi:hypothetical protein DW660_13235 [Coprobacillus sp. AM23-9LB]|jgi:hypothetical protein|nr:hypothetical protein DW660_13235 [Coprobacillus sp. AM23-9LB]